MEIHMELIPLGSTEQNAIMGTNTYAGPWDVFSRRAYPQDDEDKPHLRMGRMIEPFLIKAAFATLDPEWLVLLGMDPALTETWTWKPGKSEFVDITKDGITCPLRSTCDGKIVASPRHQRPLMLIEAKLVIYSDKELWGNPLNAQQMHPDSLQESVVPAMYYDQVQSHFMRFPDVQVCLLPVMFNYTSKPEVYWVKRNNQRIAQIQRACWEFWAHHILEETPPVADATEGMAQYLAAQEATSAEYAMGDDEAIDLVMAWFAAKDKQATADRELTGIVNRLKEKVTITGGWGLAFGDNRLHFKPNKNGRRTLSMKGLSRDCFSK